MTGEVSGADKRSVASAVPTFLRVRKQKWPNFANNNDRHINTWALMVWLTLIAQQRQTTSGYFKTDEGPILQSGGCFVTKAKIKKKRMTR